MMGEKQNSLFELEETGDPDVTRSLLDQLLADSKIYKTTDSYKDLLSFVVRLRNVAPFNAMLLQLQKPGLTYAASAYDWAKRFERLVKEDARPLLILWPFGPVATVYDVLDTEGKPLPEDVASFFASGSISSGEISNFKRLVERKKIEWQWVDAGDAKAGAIRVVERGDGKDKPTSYRVKINRNHDAPVQFTTLAHELGHLFLGHLGADKKLTIPKRRSLDHATVELEAESVAYLVCARNGIKAKSETYLANFVKPDTNLENIDLYQVMRAAGQVETILDLTAHTKFRPTKAEMGKVP